MCPRGESHQRDTTIEAHSTPAQQTPATSRHAPPHPANSSPSLFKFSLGSEEYPMGRGSARFRPLHQSLLSRYLDGHHNTTPSQV